MSVASFSICLPRPSTCSRWYAGTGHRNDRHKVLDIAFGEDDSRICAGHAAAHNLLPQERSLQVGIANNRLAAAWNKNYLCRPVGLKPKPIWKQWPYTSSCFCPLSVHQSKSQQQNPHHPQFGQRVAGIYHAVRDSGNAGTERGHGHRLRSHGR